MSSARKQIETFGFQSVVVLGLFLSLLIVLFLLFLAQASVEFISSVSLYETLTTSKWYPSEGLYGALPMVAGTVVVSALALLLAGPLSLVLSFFYFYSAPKKIKLILDLFMDVFMSIPSVVFGLWGLVVVVPLLAPLFPPGQGVLTASLILAMMIIPIGFKTFVTTLKTVPDSWLLASKSSNLSSFTVFYDIIFKNYKRHFVVGFLLQLTRAIGETIAVLMVCGNIIQFPKSLFTPVRTLTTNIALEMAYATDVHRASLFFSALLLILFVFTILCVSQKGRPSL